MLALFIHLESSLTALDHLVCGCLARYSSDSTPLLYLFCRLYAIFVSVSWLCTIPLCGVSGALKVIIGFTSLLNPWVILLIRSGWEILRIILVRSRLIVHTMKSSSSPIDQVAYYFLLYSIISINAGLYPIEIVSYTYTVTIAVLSSFTLYTIQGSVLHFFEPRLEVHYLDVFLEPATCWLYKTVDRFYQGRYIFVRIVCFKQFCHSLWYLRVDFFL